MKVWKRPVVCVGVVMAIGLFWGCSYVPELSKRDFLRRALGYVDRALPPAEKLVEATAGNDFGLMHRLALSVSELSQAAASNIEKAVESPASGKPEKDALKAARRAGDTASEMAIVLYQKLEGGEPQKLKDVDKQAAKVLEALQAAKANLEQALGREQKEG